MATNQLLRNMTDKHNIESNFCFPHKIEWNNSISQTAQKRKDTCNIWVIITVPKSHAILTNELKSKKQIDIVIPQEASIQHVMESMCTYRHLSTNMQWILMNVLYRNINQSQLNKLFSVKKTTHFHRMNKITQHILQSSICFAVNQLINQSKMCTTDKLIRSITCALTVTLLFMV